MTFEKSSPKAKLAAFRKAFVSMASRAASLAYKAATYMAPVAFVPATILTAFAANALQVGVWEADAAMAGVAASTILLGAYAHVKVWGKNYDRTPSV